MFDKGRHGQKARLDVAGDERLGECDFDRPCLTTPVDLTDSNFVGRSR